MQCLQGAALRVVAVQAERHVVEHTLPGQHAGVLEHDAHIVAQGRVERLAVQQDASGIGPFERGHLAQQRALAAAAAPDDGDEFARRQRQVDLSQHLARTIGLVQALDLHPQAGAGAFSALARHGRRVGLVHRPQPFAQGRPGALALPFEFFDGHALFPHAAALW